MVAADLRPLGGGHYGERGKAAVHADEPARVIVEARLVAALWMKVGGLDIEADVPTGAVTAAGDEQNPGQRRDLPQASVGVDLLLRSRKLSRQRPLRFFLGSQPADPCPCQPWPVRRPPGRDRSLLRPPQILAPIRHAARLGR